MRARGASVTFRDFDFEVNGRVLTLAAFPLWEVSTKIMVMMALKRLAVFLDFTFAIPVPGFMRTYDAGELPVGQHHRREPATLRII